MKYVFTALIAVVAVILLAAPATADWDETQPAKYVQLPDIDGWDVDFTERENPPPIRLADDFPCYEQGPITDVHLWFSVQGDYLWMDAYDPPSGTWTQVQVSPEEAIEKIHLSIHDNIPAGPGGDYYSRPGIRLWQGDFFTSAAGVTGSVTIRGPVDYGDQGFGWPEPGTEGHVDWWEKGDHQEIWQANILIDRDKAFVQQGTSTDRKIYWLDASMELKPGVNGSVGWKTSLDGFDPPEADDDAVFGWETDAAGVMDWYELRDPLPPYESLNLAFVITPEPGTVAMLIGAGLMGLLACIRRRRKS